MEQKEIESYRKAGAIAKQIREYAKEIIRKDVELLEIAESIEEKIKELGGDVAFPVNLSIDDVAAHYTPTNMDNAVARGLLKIDFGVAVRGYIADTAFSIDLDMKEENGRLTDAVEEALSKAIELIKEKKERTKLNEIGEMIQNSIERYGFSPIRNLSGHSLGLYEVHSGVTIPNCKDNRDSEIGEGVFAIEPFATTGSGIVYEGKSSGIYQLVGKKGVRDPVARKILEFVAEKKKTLPFSSREIEKEFGDRARIALLRLEQAGILHNFPQLIEKQHRPVSQAEHTLLILREGVEVLTN